MKNRLPWYLNTRLALSMVLLLCVTGIAGWHFASKQEDPHFAYRNGFIVVSSPGASVQQLTDSIVKPIERALSSIDEISRLNVRVKLGSATVDVELQEDEYQTDALWQRIKERLAELQSTIHNAQIDIVDRAQDTQGILLSIDSGGGLISDRQLALKVREQLLAISAVRNVTLVGDPGLQLAVDFPKSKLLSTGVSPLDLAERLQQANSQHLYAALSGNMTGMGLGAVDRLSDVHYLSQKQILTPSGAYVPLSSIADIHYRTNPLADELFWKNGKQVLGLAITLVPNAVDVELVGEEIKSLIAQINARYTQAPVSIELFQPEFSVKRIEGLMQSLLLSVTGVALVLLCLMSVRSALIVALSIPTAVLSVIAVFTSFDGVIHQMTIAGLVLSLGLMVDNGIIVTERITHFLEQGQSKFDSIIKAVTELKGPLACATLTTVAAFVPMLLAKGSVADFIATIPLLVILCIIASYLISLTLIPVLFQLLSLEIAWLRRAQQASKDRLETIGSGIAYASLNAPRRTLLYCAVAIAVLINVKSQPGEFFPKTNRNQAYVDIQLPIGSHIANTTNIGRAVEQYLNERDDITKTWMFAGFSGPRFYYNLVQQPSEAHVARVVFETHKGVSVKALVSELNQVLKTKFEALVIHARELGQGPPIESPVELRILGDDRIQSMRAAEAILERLRTHKALTNLSRGYTYGSTQLNIQFDESLLIQQGLLESQVSQYIAWRSSGLVATKLHFLHEPIDLVIYDSQASQSSTDLLNTPIINTAGNVVPLAALASQNMRGAPSFSQRMNGSPVLTIKSDVALGVDEEQLLETLQPELLAIAAHYGVRLEFGGELEEAHNAHQALVTTLPAGIALLLLALIVQFNSLRWMSVVVLSIPFGILGAPVMLALVGIPFGFMSILGVLALTGIVVNSTILLIDATLQNLAQGMSEKRAIQLAVQSRIRPVIVTTLTTIIGMVPLTFSGSPLWPPLAWAVIGGLVSSTLVILFVMPIVIHGCIPKRALQHAECNV
ncbi:efflux RND transporter permease subunit [Pseudoalteromonas sp. MMG022]|uniref:efflux RND transporter permease subunit n=1 Tax=Pseudoalteromonas sp. MMG022 TaxID=2909978 RepID=UPI0031BB0F64|nr:efflux RND transporter permease subunit [Pseudoalteromonas sp. MMG022]